MSVREDQPQYYYNDKEDLNNYNNNHKKDRNLIIIVVVCLIAALAVVGGILYKTHRTPSGLYVTATELMENKIEDSSTTFWLEVDTSVDFEVEGETSGLWGDASSPTVKISDSSILSYDAGSHKLKGLNTGDAVVRVAYGDYSRSYSIKVVSDDEIMKATNLDLTFLEVLRSTSDGYWLAEGEQQFLYCRANHNNGTYGKDLEFSFESSDESIIQIDGTTMIANKEGKATITCTYGDLTESQEIYVYPVSQNYTVSPTNSYFTYDSDTEMYEVNLTITSKENIDYDRFGFYVFLNGSKLTTDESTKHSYLGESEYSGWSNKKNDYSVTIYLNENDFTEYESLGNNLTFCLLGLNTGETSYYAQDIINVAYVEIR